MRIMQKLIGRHYSPISGVLTSMVEAETAVETALVLVVAYEHLMVAEPQTRPWFYLMRVQKELATIKENKP